MKIVVTGSAGHLGEGLVRRLRREHDVVSLDVLPSPFTTTVGSICDRPMVRDCMRGADAVVHTATLHKPHVATHSREAFVETNVAGTLVLLEEADAAGVGRFVFTSTTSTFGRALVPPPGAPAAWITEDVAPVAKNIYGVTKTSAESLCELFHGDRGLPCLVLRTSRFFPEEDDDAQVRERFADGNLKANEYLHRRVELGDAVAAHVLAIEKAPSIGFARYIISATTPFVAGDMEELRRDAPSVVARLFPGYEEEYARRGWEMAPSLDRVYVNARAREELGWAPRYDFGTVLDRLARDEDPRSALAREVGAKGYHRRRSADDPHT